MHVRIGLVLELARQEPAVGLGKLDSLFDHADASLGGRGEHHLGTEKAHQLAALDAEGLGHRDHQRIAFFGAHHGKADAGVAARGLDDRLAGFELAGPLRRLDHPESQAILYRAQGLNASILTNRLRPGARRLMRTTGVLPTVSRML